MAFHGLETLIVGWRERSDIASGGSPTAQVVVTVWQDPESMIRAIGGDDVGFLGLLGLDLTVQRADTYELTSRTFASLPTPSSVLRIAAIRARARGEAEFFDRLRGIQQRFSEQGLIASHIGRRVGPDGIDALVLGVWLDRVAIRWRLRRDVPVRGRHTILVRRSLDAAPSTEDLDAALAEAFPRAAVSSAG